MDTPDVATLKARQKVRHLATPKAEPALEFSVSRWPYTYAYDHVRNRVASVDSRGDAGQYVKLLAHDAGLPQDFICELLATAYCIENRVKLPVSLEREVQA